MDFSSPALIRQAGHAATPLESPNQNGGGSSGLIKRSPLPPPPSFKKPQSQPQSQEPQSQETQSQSADAANQLLHLQQIVLTLNQNVSQMERMEQLMNRMEEKLSRVENQLESRLCECEQLESKCTSILSRVEHLGSSMEAMEESTAFTIGKMDDFEQRLIIETTANHNQGSTSNIELLLEVKKMKEAVQLVSSAKVISNLEILIDGKFSLLEEKIIEGLLSLSSNNKLVNNVGSVPVAIIDNDNGGKEEVLPQSEHEDVGAAGTLENSAELYAFGSAPDEKMIDASAVVASLSAVTSTASPGLDAFGITAPPTTATEKEQLQYNSSRAKETETVLSNNNNLTAAAMMFTTGESPQATADNNVKNNDIGNNKPPPITPSAGFYTPSATPSSAAATAFGSINTPAHPTGSAGNFFDATPTPVAVATATPSANSVGTFDYNFASPPPASSSDAGFGFGSTPAAAARGFDSAVAEPAKTTAAIVEPVASDAVAEVFGSPSSFQQAAVSNNNVDASLPVPMVKKTITPPPTTMGTLNLLAQNKEYWAAVPLARGSMKVSEDVSDIDVGIIIDDDDDAKDTLAEVPFTEPLVEKVVPVVGTNDDDDHENEVGVDDEQLLDTVEDEAFESDAVAAPMTDVGLGKNIDNSNHFHGGVPVSSNNEADASIQTEASVLTEKSVHTEASAEPPTTAVHEAEEESNENNNDDGSNYLSFVSLPPGWVEAVDASSGKIYYFDETTGVSSWERPLVVEETAVSDDNNKAEVPGEGWDDYDDDHGDDDAGVLDESANAEVPLEESTLEEPIAAGDTTDENFENGADDAVKETAEAPLPAGWISAVDPSSGMTYYFNESTGTSSWERPVLDDDGANDAEDEAQKENDAEEEFFTEDIGPLAREEPDTMGSTHVDQHETPLTSATDGPKDNAFVEEVDETMDDDAWAASSPDAEPLAEPTTVAEPLSNECAATSTFFDDGAVATSPVEKEDSSEDAMAMVDVDVDVSDEEPVGNETAELASAMPSLPEGWIEVIEPASGKPYYYNEITGVTSWDRPVIEHSAGVDEIPMNANDFHDDAKYDNLVAEEIVEGESADRPKEELFGAQLDQGAGEKVLLEKESDNLLDEAIGTEDELDEQQPFPEAEVHRQNNAKNSFAQEHEEPVEDDISSPSSAALPEGWIEATEPSSGMVYYCNQSTGATQWDRPVDEINVVEEPVADEPSSCTEEELPEGWVEATDPSTGQVYYCNATSGATSWDRPKSASKDSSPKEEGSADDLDEIQTKEDFAKEIIDGRSSAVADQDGEQTEPVLLDEATGENSEALSDPTTADDDNVLPDGWVEATDPSSGKVYYFNAMSGESSWERPFREDSGPTQDGAVAEGQGSGDAMANLGSGAAADTAFEEPSTPQVHALPEGWVEAFDPNSGKNYYCNATSGETTWDRPQH